MRLSIKKQNSGFGDRKFIAALWIRSLPIFKPIHPFHLNCFLFWVDGIAISRTVLPIEQLKKANKWNTEMISLKEAESYWSKENWKSSGTGKGEMRGKSCCFIHFYAQGFCRRLRIPNHVQCSNFSYSKTDCGFYIYLFSVLILNIYDQKFKMGALKIHPGTGNSNRSSATT